MDKMERERKKGEALHLYGLGYKISKIAKRLKLPKSTVYRWVTETPKQSKREVKKKELLNDEIWERIVGLLLFSYKEKGRGRTLSVSQIYEDLKDELETRGILSERTFRRRLEDYIILRFGGWEGLEMERRDKKELSEYKQPKGKLKREAGTWEVDASGFPWNGETYFMLLARERWSGFIVGHTVVKAKQTGTTYYNKAFNAQSIARFLVRLFTIWGVPREVITDNEKALVADFVQEGLEKLGVRPRRVRPHNPQGKLLERVFRDIKDILRYKLATHPNKTFEEALEEAIEEYNNKQHRFENFSSPVIPSVLHQQVEVEYRRVDEETIRRAFMERHIRVVRNNSIRIENLIYEFYHPYTERIGGEIGRKREAVEVLCLRDIENLTILEVWSVDGKTFLGYAKLVSQDVPALDSAELKEIKNKEKRLNRKAERLKEELVKIEQELQQQQQPATTTFWEFLSATEPNLQVPQHQPEEEENIDVFDLL
ncbi:MAG: transposase [Thermodesulfobacterium sp.]|jgi:cation transport regulator ChaB|nr:transposase [Thermodesulfobacterium sp.]